MKIDNHFKLIAALLGVLFIELFMFIPIYYWEGNEVSIAGISIEVVAILVQIFLAIFIVNIFQKKSEDYRAIKLKFHAILEDINEKHKNTIKSFYSGGKKGTHYVLNFKIIQGRINQLNDFSNQEINVDLSELKQKYINFQIYITGNTEFNDNFNKEPAYSSEFQYNLEQHYYELEAEFISSSISILKS